MSINVLFFLEYNILNGNYRFCWVCLGPWSEHGTQWYNCNRYEEKNSIDARDHQAKSRQALERYLHVRVFILNPESFKVCHSKKIGNSLPHACFSVNYSTVLSTVRSQIT